MPTPELTVVERDVLDMAGFTFHHPGSIDAAAREWLGVTATRYHQVLGGLIDRPEALAYAPMTVKRLRARAARGRLGLDRVA